MSGNQSQGRSASEGLGTSLMTAAQAEFNAGAKPYNNPLYAGMSGTTQQGLDATVAAANASAPGLQNAYNWNNQFLQGGGWGQGQQEAMATSGQVGNQFGQIASGLSGPSSAQTGFGNIANGLSGPSAAQTQYQGIANGLGGPSAAQTGFGDMAAGARDPSLTEQQLLSVAQGQAMGENAPGFAALRGQLADDTLTGINSSFLSGGRFGSSVHGENAAKGLSSTLANLDYTNYQNDIARQERALGAVEGQRQQGFQNQFNALGASDSARLNQLNTQMGAIGAADTARLNQTNTQMSALGQSDTARLNQNSAQMAALSAQQGTAQNQFAMGQQGVANQAAAAASMPGYAQAMLMPGQAITQAGQVRDADAQAQRLADYDLWTRQNDARTNQIAQYASILQGSANMPGTEQQTPWWQTALGAGATMAGAFF